MKLVSILIPAYKPSHFRMCLASAVAQTWENREIIVSDDCPTDAIRDIVAEFGAQVTYLRNPNPGGWGVNNVNHVMAAAKGDYIKFLFDDDILHPFCTQYLVEALEATADRNVKLAFSPRRTIDEHNHPIELINPFGVTSTTVIEGREIIRRMAKTLLNPIGELTTVLFRKQDLAEPDGSIEFMKIRGKPCNGLGDVSVFTHLLAKGNAVAAPDTLSYFRIHTGSLSSHGKNGNWPHLIMDWRKVIDLAADEGIVEGSELYSAYVYLAENIRAWLHAYPDFAETFAGELEDIAVSARRLPLDDQEQKALAALARSFIPHKKGLLAKLRAVAF
ncbi:glycosyltransferase family 2 protein [Methylocystis sp. IM3]|uniref:glycosyltransferase family 2 protein n=2 Tax=Methylocystis TaxID=133 RepID=UPI003119DB0D